MDTSDRQVAETGRNRELGLIPAMVMAVVATLSGAGVSFAPLYERIWGGMMLHPNCPAIGCCGSTGLFAPSALFGV